MNVYQLIVLQCFMFYFMIYWLVFYNVSLVCFKKYFHLCLYGCFTIFHTVLFKFVSQNIVCFVFNIFDDVSWNNTCCFSTNWFVLYFWNISHYSSMFFAPHYFPAGNLLPPPPIPSSLSPSPESPIMSRVQSWDSHNLEIAIIATIISHARQITGPTFANDASVVGIFVRPCPGNGAEPRRSICFTK